MIMGLVPRVPFAEKARPGKPAEQQEQCSDSCQGYWQESDMKVKEVYEERGKHTAQHEARCHPEKERKLEAQRLPVEYS